MNFERLIDKNNDLKPAFLNNILKKIEEYDNNFQYFDKTDQHTPVIIADWNNSKLDKIESFLSDLEINGNANIMAGWSENWVICDQYGKGIYFDHNYTNGNIKGIIGDGFALCNECLLDNLSIAIEHYTSFEAVYSANYLDSQDIKNALIKDERFVELNSKTFNNVFDEDEYKLFLGNYPFDNMNNPFKIWDKLTKQGYQIIIYTGPGKEFYNNFSILVRLNEN